MAKVRTQRTARIAIDTMESHPLVNVMPAIHVAISAEMLLPGMQYRAPRALAYSNMNQFDHELHDAEMRAQYEQRTCIIDPIHLCRMPRGAKVYGDNSIVDLGSAVVADQIVPNFRGRPDIIRGAIETRWPFTHISDYILSPSTAPVIAPSRPIEHIAGETLLITRYGDGTWGHWLVELLPKVVLAEAAYPGRFRYALPRSLLSVDEVRSFRKSARESLEAYGIGGERLIGFTRDCDYVCDSLYVVTPIISDRMPHPGVLKMMRRLPVRVEHAESRVALLRTDSRSRRLVNRPEVAEFLAARGFALKETGNLPFLEQVALFQQARCVVGVLGSALTGLMYSPAGVCVTSVAPPLFRDYFFYALVQARCGRWADVRGPTVEQHPDNPGRDDSFRINVGEIGDSLKAIGADNSAITADISRAS